jgi:hypothetical protein
MTRVTAHRSPLACTDMRVGGERVQHMTPDDAVTVVVGAGAARPGKVDWFSPASAGPHAGGRS